MPVTVGMYEKSYAHIRPRLDALGLDVRIHTFDRDSMFDLDGVKTKPEAVSLDYMWLSSAINVDQFQAGAFELCLACKRIGVLQTFNAGLDHPFYKKISAKGTRICNSSAQAVAISEYVFGQLLSVLQPIEQQRQLQSRKEWKITPYREIAGQAWVIVGFGPIGREIAKRAKAFGATTSIVRRTVLQSEHADMVGTLADLATMASKADVVVLACPLNAQTKGVIGASFFEHVKPGTILINIARGAVIDDRALLAALDKGQIGTAILDVFSEEPLPTTDPLWSHPNVRMTSHTSFAGSGVRSRWDALFLDNIARFARGEQLVNEFNPADFP